MLLNIHLKINSMLCEFHLNGKQRVNSLRESLRKKIFKPTVCFLWTSHILASIGEKKKTLTCTFWSMQSCETHVLNKLKLWTDWTQEANRAIRLRLSLLTRCVPASKQQCPYPLCYFHFPSFIKDSTFGWNPGVGGMLGWKERDVLGNWASTGSRLAVIGAIVLVNGLRTS